MKDDGYFSALDPIRRVALAEKTFDVGEYLLRLHRSGELEHRFCPGSRAGGLFPPLPPAGAGIRAAVSGTARYGSRALNLEAIQGNLYCCGLAGVMGFKRDFHEASLALGSRLIAENQRA